MLSPGLRNKCHSKFNYVYSKGENKGLKAHGPHHSLEQQFSSLDLRFCASQ